LREENTGFKVWVTVDWVKNGPSPRWRLGKTLGLLSYKLPDTEMIALHPFKG